MESVQNAVEQAKSIAAGIAGNYKPYHKVPWFWSDQYNIKLQIAGISQSHDSHVVRGSPEEEKFAVFYQKENRLIAIDAVNSPREFMVGKKLIEMQSEIPFELIRNMDVDLKRNNQIRLIITRLLIEIFFYKAVKRLITSSLESYLSFFRINRFLLQ